MRRPVWQPDGPAFRMVGRPGYVEVICPACGGLSRLTNAEWVTLAEEQIQIRCRGCGYCRVVMLHGPLPPQEVAV